MKYRQAKKNIKKEIIHVSGLLEGNPFNASATAKFNSLHSELQLLKLWKYTK